METTTERLHQSYHRQYPDAVLSNRTAMQERELNDFERCYFISGNGRNITELQRDKKETLLKGDGDMIHWWRDNRQRHPPLSRIAQDLLAVPTTTAADKRVSSESDDVVNNERPLLGENSPECLRS